MLPSAFQSTLPMRGATAHGSVTIAVSHDFNPHSPCGERRKSRCVVCLESRFQSTLPMRGATAPAAFALTWWQISIHTPHAGSDVLLFQPSVFIKQFQSTLPMRGATAKVTEFTLNLKTKFMTFGTKTNCETLQSSVSRICSNEKNYISQVRISKQFMIASHSHIYKISGSSGIYDALFPKCSTFF